MNDSEAPGEVQKLETLMSQYGDNVLRVCYMTLRDRELARDAAQETFLKAYRALPTLRSEETEKAWLTRIAVNVCRDIQRKAWWRLIDRRITPEDLPEAFTEDKLPDSTPLLAVMNLPRALRQTVVLHYYQGMTLAEIARALGEKPSTVRGRLIRARKKLYDKLERWYFNE